MESGPESGEGPAPEIASFFAKMPARGAFGMARFVSDSCGMRRIGPLVVLREGGKNAAVRGMRTAAFVSGSESCYRIISKRV